MNSSFWGKRLWAVIAMLSLIASLSVGCTSARPAYDEERVLRIGMVYGSGNEANFRQAYVDAFEVTHPGITIELVPAIYGGSYGRNAKQEEDQDIMKNLKKIMTGDNPVDVVIVSDEILTRLVRENLVKPLDPLIQKDKFDTSGIVPAVLEGAKAIGDQHIYGLSPTFTASALFYNKKIFQEAGVEPPTDNMTWDEVFNLARRAARGEGQDRIYGLSFTQWRDGLGPFNYMVSDYVAPLQLKLVDEQTGKMAVNSPQWEKVLTTISGLVADKVLFRGYKGQYIEQTPTYDTDLFISGDTAMLVADYSYVGQLNDAIEYAKKNNGSSIDWDVAAFPMHPEAPETGGIKLNNLTAINNAAPNVEDAWEFVKFLNGDDYAKIRSHSGSELVARKKYIRPQGGLDYHIEAFAARKPVPPSVSDEPLLSSLELSKLFWEVEMSGETFFEKVADSQATPKEALAEWEQAGNEILAKFKKEPQGGD
ncbi:extracellular solute-binding protein [Paenibacillus macerans]|uniref:ABC transporter substrate-binding protein n=1 Tax=Paenibacillus macerans TaxID=44252 RepID=UPI002DBC227D|nr:extracellular solute-binding protein [Paenibacillus macerans]MEC0328767.1 extracellular solute-binding protein [Paenibacillus macerans]MED4954213.1 extracellular solute-binding protein [Paenibacillus macerans]